MTRILHLYRPRLPGQRAQAIQVVHAAHALARRGADVTLLADRSHPDATPRDALAALGLSPVDGLHIHLAPVVHKGAAGLWFRGALARWALGAPGVVLARDLRRLVEARSWLSRHRVVIEVHGQDDHPFERRALELSSAVIANCEGTAASWERAYGDRLPGPIHVAHNGTAPHRHRSIRAPDGVVRTVGSLRPYKGWDTLLDAAAAGLDVPLELVGGGGTLDRTLPPGVTLRPPVAFPDVPDLLARSAALVLPLADNRFGRVLTSPLKLFDYLATPTPLVLPRLPTVERALRAAKATDSGLFWYTAGHPASLRSAIHAAVRAPGRAPVLRSWDHRLDPLAPLFDLPATSS